MNITRAQGRAALKRMEPMPSRCTCAHQLGVFWYCPVHGKQYRALAMVVAISEVET